MIDKNKNYEALTLARSHRVPFFVINPLKFQTALEGESDYFDYEKKAIAAATKLANLIGSIKRTRTMTAIVEYVETGQLIVDDTEMFWQQVDGVKELLSKGIPLEEFVQYAAGELTLIVNSTNTIIDPKKYAVDFFAFPNANYVKLKELDLI